MHISVDLDKLRQHRDSLQKQIILADRIVKQLQQLPLSEPYSYGMNEQLYQDQVLFAKKLASRLRERQKLLSDIIDVLAHAHVHLTTNSSDATYLLGHEE